jgi:hypothetical protein
MTSNLVGVGAGGIPLQSTVEQVYQNWGVYMVGTEVYILVYPRTDHVCSCLSMNNDKGTKGSDKGV